MSAVAFSKPTTFSLSVFKCALETIKNLYNHINIVSKIPNLIWISGI